MLFLLVGAVAFTAACSFLESGMDAVDEAKKKAFGEALEKAAPNAWLVVHQGRVHGLVQSAAYAALALDGVQMGCPLRAEDLGSLPPGVPEDVAIAHYKGVGRYVAG